MQCASVFQSTTTYAERAKHHVKHAQLNTTIEKQAELRQKTNLHNMAVARQHHHHEHNKCHRKHVHQMERPTPAERVRNPRANRHTHHEHAIIRRERAQHIASKKHPNQRQMRGKTRYNDER